MPLQCKLMLTFFSRAQPLYVIVRFILIHQDEEAIQRLWTDVGCSGTEINLIAQFDPFIYTSKRKASWGNTRESSVYHISCFLNQVQVLNNKAKGDLFW
jgi:hypothetical protein